MKKLMPLIILILLIPTVLADETDWIFDSQYATYGLEISSSIIREPETRDITANLLLTPQNTFRQERLSLITTPSSPDLKFNWPSPEQKKLNFKLESNVKTKLEIPKIPQKVKFPQEIYDFPEFRSSSESIDSNDPKIVELASQLASGEDDMYEVVFKLANWVESNIAYSLDTVTEKASKSSSWVLKNRRGVCDELTNLFIALARALDMPARFVSGYAYTNSDGKDEWGPHGWAEVYFPDYGWVPFDTTYKQFGWIDLSHITLKHSVDALEPSVKYTWKGSVIKPENLKVTIEPKQQGPKLDYSPLNMEVSILKSQTGFGSYNMVIVDLENRGNYYLAPELRIFTSDSIDIIDKPYSIVLLKPNQKKKVYFIIKTNDDLDERYRYTSFIEARTAFNKAKAEFSAVKKDQIFSLKEMRELKVDTGKEELLPYSSLVDLSCIVSNKEFYVYEDQTIECTLINKGDQTIMNAKLCFKECETLNLPIRKLIEREYYFSPSKTGKRDLKVKIKHPEIYKTALMPVTILGEPSIDVKIEAPKRLKFKEIAVINYTIKSETPAYDLNLELKTSDYTLQKEVLEELTGQRFIVKVPGSILRAGRNYLLLNLTYKDKNKIQYQTQKEIEIDLVNVTFWQKVQLWLQHLFR